MEIQLEQLSDESNKVYVERKNFIKSALKKKKYSMSELIKYSKIWANIKYKGCKYPPKIYNIIRSLTNDLKKKTEDFIEEDS
jgi:hypothetical protein